MKKKITDNELDLIDIFFIISKNKSKLFLITLITVSLSLGYYLSSEKVISSRTNILPISIFEENLYLPYNTYIQVLKKNNNEIEKEDIKLKFNKIDRNFLTKLFLEKIKERRLLIDAIDKFELVNKNNFKNEILYLNEIEKLALNTDLVAPNKNQINWVIQSDINDEDKWIEILRYINNKINKEINAALIEDFNLYLKTSK